MRASPPVALALVLAVGLLSGCGASSQLAPADNTTSSEAAEVTTSLGDTPELMDDGLFSASEEVYVLDDLAANGALGPEAQGDAGLVTMSPIKPLRWWREIESIRRHFEFAFADTDTTGRPTVVIVTVKKLLRGSFNILALDPTADQVTDAFLVRKRLADLAGHKFVLKRVPRPTDAILDIQRHRRWKLVGISGIKVESILPDISADVSNIDLATVAPATDTPTRIRGIRLVSEGIDETVTDPLELQRLSALMKFRPGQEVKVIVYTHAPDDVVVLMQRNGNHKLRLHNNGDNSYEGKWIVPRHRGFRFVGFNALSNGTLFDDQDPYNSSAWILPYVVEGMGPSLAWAD